MTSEDPDYDDGLCLVLLIQRKILQKLEPHDYAWTAYRLQILGTVWLPPYLLHLFLRMFKNFRNTWHCLYLISPCSSWYRGNDDAHVTVLALLDEADEHIGTVVWRGSAVKESQLLDEAVRWVWRERESVEVTMPPEHAPSWSDSTERNQRRLVDSMSNKTIQEVPHIMCNAYSLMSAQLADLVWSNPSLAGMNGENICI